jgi:hypothetical protein
MDFNTGGSGGQDPNDPSRPMFGGGPSGPSPGPAGGSGREFDLSDPVGSFVVTVRSIVLNPVGFFRDMPRRGGFVNPLVFAVICAVVYGVLSGIIGFLINLVVGNGFGSSFLGLLGSIVGTPIGTVVGLFIGAGIFHLLVLLLVKPSNAGFEATFRVVAYATVTLLVTWLAVIPILGVLVSLAAAVYSIFLNVVGIRETHATTTGRAALVVLIPVAVFALLALIVLVIVGIGAALYLNSL